MYIVISVNEQVSDFLRRVPGVPDYEASLRLYSELKSRGHDVYFAHPTQMKDGGRFIGFDRTYRFDGGRLVDSGVKSGMFKPDVFFVRGLGEDAKDPSVSRNFLDSLYALEDQSGVMLNSAKSTSYEYKPNQKELDLPFIPWYDVHSREKLESLLLADKRIIAKPNMGFQGVGVQYLEDAKSISGFNGGVGNYSFEKFMPETTETRYIFLDENLILRRVLEKKGDPGKEKSLSAHLDLCFPEGHAGIVRRAVDMTGMFYGCVDFRQGYVLEINGSGTGTVYNDAQKGEVTICPQIADAIEEAYSDL